MRRYILALALLTGAATVGRADGIEGPRLLVFAGGSMGNVNPGDRGFGGEVGAEFRLSRLLSVAARAHQLRATTVECWSPGGNANCADMHKTSTTAGVEVRVMTPRGPRESPFSGYLSGGFLLGHYRQAHPVFDESGSGLGLGVGAGLTVRLQSRLHLYVEGRFNAYDGGAAACGDINFCVQPDARAGLQFGF